MVPDKRTFFSVLSGDETLGKTGRVDKEDSEAASGSAFVLADARSVEDA